MSRGFEFGFSDKRVTKDTVYSFCKRRMHMKSPIIEHYSCFDGSTSLHVVDQSLSSHQFEIIFFEGPATDGIHVDIAILPLYVDGNIRHPVFQAYTKNSVELQLLRHERMQVHVYVLCQDFSIIKLRTEFGVYRHENTVYFNHDLSKFGKHPNAEVLWLHHKLDSAQAYIWYYNDDQTKAIETLKKVKRKQRNKYLRRLHESKSAKPKWERRASRKNSNYLQQLFMFVGAPKSLATRLTNILNRYYGIYNLSDFRSINVDEADLLYKRHAGPKCAGLYRDAWALVHSLRNANM
jgi:hypothetical protein